MSDSKIESLAVLERKYEALNLVVTHLNELYEVVHLLYKDYERFPELNHWISIENCVPHSLDEWELVLYAKIAELSGEEQHRVSRG
jgi:uncharacterized membrane protein YgaE (UPF0421/DUF939 family)